MRQLALLLLSLPVAYALAAVPAMGQGYGGPLTTQGLHQQNLHSAAVRAFGGVTTGARNDVGLMFHNPATMYSLEGIQVSLGGFTQSVDLRQEQHYAPVRYFPNLSLLLEGLTHRIPDPDPDRIGFTPADSVQRPFDDLGPNWSRSLSHNMPLQAVVAVPFTFEDFRIVAGVGAVEYANLNHFYQNNNVLSPNVLSQRPVPVPRPSDNNPLGVDWYQTLRSREGSIHGYGFALAGQLTRYDISVGISGLFFDGSSDDFEQEVARGRLTFFANAFRAQPASGGVTKIGTSKFSGQEFTVSSTVNSEYVSVGFALRPPTTFTRTFSSTVEADTSGALVSSAVNGEDNLRLPLRGTVGMSLTPRDNLRLGLEYEFRPYGSATFTDADGNESSPWVSASLFRIGGEYAVTPWFLLRAGMRGEADVFVPDGSAIEDQPVSHTVYSAGFGILFSGVRLNVAYESANRVYQDIWGSAISNNRDARHTIVGDLSFTIPWRALR